MNEQDQEIPDHEIRAALESLPTPDLVRPGKITDPIGADAYYSARSVVALLYKQALIYKRLLDGAESNKPT